LGASDKTRSDKSKPDKTKPLAGGVRHDARGNAVWQWTTETARHAVASTSQLLRRLEVSNLKLEQLDENKPGEAGFNPYEGAASARDTPPVGAASARAATAKQQAAKKPAAKPPAAGKKPSGAPARVHIPWWRALFRRR
jgi:hypothetical protein